MRAYGAFDTGRRAFLAGGAAFAAASVVPAFVHAGEAAEGSDAEEISPAEDLMREHAVLSRILLIYDAAREGLLGGAQFPADVIAGSAQIVKKFIEDYHEKLEEDYVFPRFKKAGVLEDLVSILAKQHDAGRKLTEGISSRATQTALENPDELKTLVEDLRLFTRMYRPHKARESTVLFPAMRRIISPKEYGEMGDEFEKQETDKFGERGFFGVVDEVAALEQRVGLLDLGQFTPKA